MVKSTDKLENMKNRRNTQHSFTMVEVLLIVVLVVVMAVAGHLFLKNRDHHPSSVNSSSHSDEVTFSGTVTNLSHECNVDGTCSVTVDGKLIITGSGLSPNASDNVYGTSDVQNIGDKVDVKAIKSSYGYTLQGCSSCYIKQHH